MKCEMEFTEDDYKYAETGETDPETGQISPVGDYDFVCYTCQIDMMGLDGWEDFVNNEGRVFPTDNEEIDEF